MEEKYKNSEFRILQDCRKPTLYTVEFPFRSMVLINSIKETKQLNTFTISSDYIFFTFKATSVKTFNKFLNDISVVRG